VKIFNSSIDNITNNEIKKKNEFEKKKISICSGYHFSLNNLKEKINEQKEKEKEKYFEIKEIISSIDKSFNNKSEEDKIKNKQNFTIKHISKLQLDNNDNDIFTFNKFLTNRIMKSKKINENKNKYNIKNKNKINFSSLSIAGDNNLKFRNSLYNKSMEKNKIFFDLNDFMM
jgi:hypothetical protein